MDTFQHDMEQMQRAVTHGAAINLETVAKTAQHDTRKQRLHNRQSAGPTTPRTTPGQVGAGNV